VSPVVHMLPSLQDAPVLTTQLPELIEHVVHVPQAAPEFCQVPVVLQA